MGTIPELWNSPPLLRITHYYYTVSGFGPDSLLFCLRVLRARAVVLISLI